MDPYVPLVFLAMKDVRESAGDRVPLEHEHPEAAPAGEQGGGPKAANARADHDGIVTGGGLPGARELAGAVHRVTRAGATPAQGGQNL